MISFYILFGMITVRLCPALSYTVEELRCEICRCLASEVQNIIQDIGMAALAKVGSHRLDEKGNLMSREIPLVQSETFLVEALESACGRMEDYARGYDKRTHKLRVVKMQTKNKLNPEMSKIIVISDADLNESLKYYCEGIADEYENEFVRVFQAEKSDAAERVCAAETHLCKWKDDHTEL